MTPSRERFYSGFWPAYLVTAIQNSLLQASKLPDAFLLGGKGTGRFLTIDWTACVAALNPMPGSPMTPTLFALQVVYGSPAFHDVCPLLRHRLSSFEPLLLPAYPSLRTDHLSPDGVDVLNAPHVPHFDRLRQQVYRLLKGRPSVHLTLRKEFEKALVAHLGKRPKGAEPGTTYLDVSKLSVDPGLNDAAIEGLKSLRCGDAVQVRTTPSEEAAAILRLERYGAVVEKNYVVVRHTGMAEHALGLGDWPAWATAATMRTVDESARLANAADDLRNWLRRTFRALNDLSAERFFKTSTALASAGGYDPERFTVVYRQDMVDKARAEAPRAKSKAQVDVDLLGDTDTLSPREPFAFAPKRRYILRLDGVEVPEHFEDVARRVNLARRRHVVYVNLNAFGDVPLRAVLGLPREDFIAFDEHGRSIYHFSSQPHELYVSLNVVAERLKRPAFAEWVASTHGAMTVWRNLLGLKGAKDERALLKAALFTREQDEYFLKHCARYAREAVWSEAERLMPMHSLKRMKERAKFVRFAVQRKGLTIDALRDLKRVEALFGPRGIKKWSPIYKASA